MTAQVIGVLSWLRPLLEPKLTAHGDEFVVLMPPSTRDGRIAEDPQYPILTVEQWDDYSELARLAGEFETLGVTTIATVDEMCMRAAAFLRGLLGLPGQSFASAVACTDKAVMKQRLAAAGIPAAEHRVVRNVAEVKAVLDELGGDIIVKPRAGAGSVSTHRVTHENFDQLVADGAFDPPRDVPAHFQSTPLAAGIGEVSFQAERFIHVVAEYHCELLLHEGDEVHCFAARYSAPVLSSTATFGSVLLEPTSEEAATVCELTRAAASALGVTHGFVHGEVLLDSSGNWLVGELGSRPGGAVVPRMLQLAYGIDTWELMAQQVSGHRPPSNVTPIVAGAVAWLALPVEGSGVIVEAPTKEQLLALPGVIDVELRLRPGDSTINLQGSASHAAYVFTLGETPEQAEELAQQAKASYRIAAGTPA